ncbi:hypothetical protein [uncultured Draconibacterium sp.]|uniref:hypothetical protein n=1 Tax=uncultured Draconibacterium sp. TaxID=1573823 RepID=UPI0029C7444C|nr:hypothetical protein [uncultured Draconibacterium sp.]
MQYTLEEIYLLVGKEDKTAGLTFNRDSEAYLNYGSFITVVFLYTQGEREEMDEMVQTEPFSHHGRIKAKYLGIELPGEKVEQLLSEGINSEDIAELLYPKFPITNTFHSKEIRTIRKVDIPVRMLPKGRDLDWMYGFNKKLVTEGVGLSPKERNFYLAGKYYYEAENLSDDEKQEIFDENGHLNESVEWEYLRMKTVREDINEEEKQRLAELYENKSRNSIQLLDHYLKQAGSSLKKLAQNNIEKATELLVKIRQFKERRLTVTGQNPIYLDIDSYLHIYMRHVEEYKVNEHFEHKDNFQWNEGDVFVVMKHVIEQIDEDYQEFRKSNPEQRYSKYGSQSVYFEGDYYTFHIEPNGRISTFHKNRKEHEKAKEK